MAAHNDRVPKETLDAIHEMSELLNTGLNRESLRILAELCDDGVNPNALAQVVRELHSEKEAARLRREAGRNATNNNSSR